MPDAAAPIFVGGTGRSGTTIFAKILGSHADMYMIPIEIRFIVDPGGLCDLVSEDTELAQFERRLLGPWWHRTVPDGSTRGLHKIVERAAIAGALERLREKGASPTSARQFVHEILDPLAASNRARRWIEMTPPNVARGRQLMQILPEMKLIHTARDGKDVACSVAPLGWGPSDPLSGLDWWGDRMLEAYRACQGMSPESLLEIRMEDLNGSTSTRTLERLFEFIGETPDQSVRDFFASNVSPDRAHIDRWRRDLTPSMQKQVQARYERVLDRLRSEGFPTDKWGFDRERGK